jgi:SPP1 family predicted phage head-tail adaptor
VTRAGELDQRVIVQRHVRVPDEGGGYAESWEDEATVWAKVEPIGGRERVQAQQTEAPVNYRITVRRRTDISAGDRLLWLGRVLNIRFVGLPGLRQPFMEMDAEMGVQS